jgi:NADPH:quinone reductase
VSRAIRIHATGGPEQLRFEQVPLAPPGEGEVQIRHTAIGVNYIDVYDRTGLYPLPLPAVLGREAAGVVVAVGRGAKLFAPGMRVAYADAAPGAYCEQRNISTARLVALPDDIADDTAAAMMLKGLTAQYLLRATCRVKRGDRILVHAAAGGVGLILIQWAKYLGVSAIAVVGSEAKAELVRAQGCEDVLVVSPPELAARVKAMTAGKGVRVVYDSVGKDTFFASLDCLAPLGMMVSFGNASGPVPPIAPFELAKRGSLFLTRPSLFHYTATPAVLKKNAAELIDVVRRGAVKITIGQRYALANAAAAHRDLEARKTTGSTVLLPEGTLLR